MADDYFNLGDLDCLQDIDVPKNVGDLQTRITYPEYQDIRYIGLGLQTPQMSLGIHESLFKNNGALSNIRTIILKRVGVWQIECGDFRVYNDSSEELYCIHRQSLKWHMDTGDMRTHRMLGCCKGCENASGETDVTTLNVLLMDVYAKNPKINQYISNKIREYQNEFFYIYSAEVIKLIRSSYTELAVGNDCQYIKDSAIARPASVIRHFYNPNDPKKPDDIEAYSTLAWDDSTMVHAAPDASGKIQSRSFTI